MPQRVVITGAGGFVGQWLARALLARGDTVWLTGHEPDASSLTILTEEERSRARWLTVDVRRDADMTRMFEVAGPDVIFHLAAISHVPDAEGAPSNAYDVNVVGAVRLLTAAVASRMAGGTDPMILIVGSATQYGSHPPSDMPLRESAEQRPLSAYATTKAAQELAALQIARAKGLRVVCTRSFSHSGVGHDRVFLIPSIISRVQALGPAPRVIRIGNDVVRDFLHVDDAVTAYLALAERGVPCEAYNVCSGIGVSVRELVTAALERAGITAEIVPDPALQRPADMPVLVGSPAKLIAATGWRPTKTYKDIFVDLIPR